MRMSEWSSDVCSSDLQGLLALPLLRQGIAVERRRRRAAGAWNVHQDGRDAATQVRGAVESDHEGHADLDIDSQREGQQDDDGVVGGKAGHRADDDAEYYGREDDPRETERVAKKLPEEIEAYVHCWKLGRAHV